MKSTLLLFSLLTTLFVNAQERSIAFYNIENLFDTLDHPVNNDNEFLPNAERAWNSAKYWEKIAHVNQVFDSLGQPAIFGMCELENATVMHDLIAKSSRPDYQLVHFDSDDQRGVDNAMIYDPTVFTLQGSGKLKIEMPAPDGPTRDIVWAKFSVNNSTDTLFAMVNHWPSRRGGQAESEPKRMAAAIVARSFIDSLLAANKKAKIVFMGDLNDHPQDRAPQMISEVLRPMISKKSGDFGGSHCYQNEWDVLDHIMVSKGLLKGKTKVKKKSGTIYSAEYLIEEYKGNRVPFRTYGGMKYLGGYSDHFPVKVTLKL